MVSVSKIASMLEKSTERERPQLPAAAGSPSGRFARDPGEYPMRGGTQLTAIRGNTTRCRRHRTRSDSRGPPQREAKIGQPPGMVATV
jgi:hypothetical protein